MPWYVLYTKPRNEKKTATLLEQRGVVAYCPTQEVVKQWSDRKKKINEPIFKSYVFVHLEDYNAEQITVLTTPGAVRFLWWQKKPGIVREEEIEAIKSLLNKYKGAKVTVQLHEGQDISIAEGPLKGQSGSIVKISGRKAFIYLRSLGWNVTVDLPLQSLNPI